MNAYRAVIVEDEPLARVRLETLLRDVAWLHVVGVAADGLTGRRLIDAEVPDVAFLDIAMPGLSGVDVARSLDPTPLIVFTTAYSGHAAEAYDIGAVDYLVKPFGRRRVEAMLERLHTRLRTRRTQPGLEHIVIRRGTTVSNVPVSQIIRFQGDDDYVTVHTSQRRHLCDTRLNELEARLPTSEFLRVHRSHIINRRAIREISTDGTGRLIATMVDGARIRSSRGRAPVLRALVRTD